MDETVPLMKGCDGMDDCYQSDDIMESSMGRRITKLVRDFSITKSVEKFTKFDTAPLGGCYITPDSRQYEIWWHFMVVASMFSSMFTPFEFGFFKGLPHVLWVIDLWVQAIFIADIVLRFFTAFKDPETYRLVVDHRSIARRYIGGEFSLELLACLPWDTIYKMTGRKEEVRYLLWLRFYRVVKVDSCFGRIEKDIRLNYFAVRIVKLLAVEIYCVHTAACIYHYLATTVRPSEESYTWIGSLVEGSFSYTDFRAVGLGTRYATSLYWAIVTMTTVGYGDVHGVNIKEMIFIMIYASFNMFLAAYLLGNVTALIVRGSPTEKFRDKMTSLVRFMNRHQLSHNIRKEMKKHVVLQFEAGIHTEDEVLGDLPNSIRLKVAQSLYGDVVRKIPIFRGCSIEFLDEIIGRVVEEHYLPGEVVVHQGGASDQFFIICHGLVEEILVHEDGKEEFIEKHGAESIFGEVGVLCSIPQPFSVRVLELCRVLRLDKHSFTDLVQIYFNDGRLLINNLLEWKDTDARIGQIAADVTFLVAKHAAELSLMVNNASYQGDLVQLKHLVKQGAIVARADYDGRTALHLAASKGFDSVVLYLLRENADINAIDKFGMTPLLEAVKGGHDHCMSVLVEQGAQLNLQESGTFLCQAVSNGNNDLLRRLLLVGADPSAADYDKRTPLHLAAAEGHAAIANLLIDAGADVSAKDVWGRTPLDEAILREHAPLVPILQEAVQKRKQVHAHSRLKRQFTETSHGGDKRLGHGEPERSAGHASSGHSSHSGDSSSGSHKRGHSHSGHHQRPHSGHQHAGPERTLTSVASIGASSRRALDFENAARQYRMLPVRRKGRHPHVEHTAAAATGRSSRRRVTVFPFHPFAPVGARSGGGRVDWVPPNILGILHLAYQHFGKDGSKVLNNDAGEIQSTDLIMDSEKVFVVDDNDVRMYSALVRPQS